MIVDRYEPVNLVALAPKVVADIAPEPPELDQLPAGDVIVQGINAAMAQRRRGRTAGRYRTPWKRRRGFRPSNGCNA
jgi:hypothetical protein